MYISHISTQKYQYIHEKKRMPHLHLQAPLIGQRRAVTHQPLAFHRSAFQARQTGLTFDNKKSGIFSEDVVRQKNQIRNNRNKIKKKQKRKTKNRCSSSVFFCLDFFNGVTCLHLSTSSPSSHGTHGRRKQQRRKRSLQLQDDLRRRSHKKIKGPWKKVQGLSYHTKSNVLKNKNTDMNHETNCLKNSGLNKWAPPILDLNTFQPAT